MPKRNGYDIDKEKLKRELSRRGLNMSKLSLEMGKSSNYISNTIERGNIDTLAMSYLKNTYNIDYSDIKTDGESVMERQNIVVNDIDYDQLADALVKAVAVDLQTKGELFKGLKTVIASATYSSMCHFIESKNNDLNQLLFTSINGAIKYNANNDKYMKPKGDTNGNTLRNR